MPTRMFETLFHVANEMGSVLPLDGFVGRLRELPEFADWTGEQLQGLYAKNYLPWMQQKKAATQQQAEQRRGLIGGLISARSPYSAPAPTGAGVGVVPVIDQNGTLTWQRRT